MLYDIAAASPAAPLEPQAPFAGGLPVTRARGAARTTEQRPAASQEPHDNFSDDEPPGDDVLEVWWERAQCT